MPTEDWKVVEHSWAETSILAGDRVIARLSIEDEATEETQEQLEGEMREHAKMLAAAPKLRRALEEARAFIGRLLDNTPDEVTDLLTNEGEEVEERLQAALIAADPTTRVEDPV